MLSAFWDLSYSVAPFQNNGKREWGGEKSFSGKKNSRYLIRIQRHNFYQRNTVSLPRIVLHGYIRKQKTSTLENNSDFGHVREKNECCTKRMTILLYGNQTQLWQQDKPGSFITFLEAAHQHACL